MPCRPAISSMSLGRAWEHDFHSKLADAARAGFEGIEIFYEDIEYQAKEHGEANHENLVKAAAEIRKWCTELDLEIINLQPFMSYEGLTDREEHAKRITKLAFWFELVKVLETDLIQVPSNFAAPEEVSSDIELIVSDMLEIAELGLKQTPIVRFAYENLAWGTRVDTWEQIWEVVKRVNRSNFGMCLDSFNICGRVWADPASPSGMTENADEELEDSITRLVKSVDVEKIFFVQIVDAERMNSPLVLGHPFHQEHQPARMSWSRNARLFAYEGGYLPILKIAKALFEDLRFQGWVSMELFSRSMAKPGADVPPSHADRAITSWKKLADDFNLM